MLKLVTQMTDEELRTEDYDLELESQHYDFRADGETDPETLEGYDLTQGDISFRRLVIQLEQERRYKAESAHYNVLADQAAYQRMVEA
jgi:hypothetical protein